MKKLVSILLVLALMLSFAGFLGQQPAQADTSSKFTLSSSPILLAKAKRRNPADAKLETAYGQKIDLNNSSVLKFIDVPGFYPTLAGLIIDNAPYKKVEDVFNIPGLSESQKKKLKDNMKKFVATPPTDAFVEEANRYNPGVY